MTVDRSRLTLFVCAFAGTAFAVSTRADAAMLSVMGMNVGSIVVDDYRTRDPGGTLLGANFICHYTLNDLFDHQMCVTRPQLRWIQRVTLNKAVPLDFDNPAGGMLTPNPNRPFIDPRQGQPISGGAGDNLPFYDFTDADGTMGFPIRNGTGVYLGDGPQMDVRNATVGSDVTFTAESLLVADAGNMMLGILGGVRWGYKISTTDGANFSAMIQPNPSEMLSDSAALRTDFNTALAADFPGWVIKDSNVLWPVPTPGTTVVFGAFAVIGVRRRRAA